MIKKIKNFCAKFLSRFNSSKSVNLKELLNEQSKNKEEAFIMPDGMGELIIDITSLKESKAIKTELKNIR